MTTMSLERLGRASGIGFVVLFIVAIITYGTPPKVNDSAAEITSFFDGDRGRILISLVIFGIAFVLLLLFIGAIAYALSEAGQGWWAAATITTGATFVAIQAVTGAIAGALALNIAGIGDEGAVTSLNTLLSTADVTSAYPLAGLILIASVGLTRAGVLAPWYSWLGLLAATLVFLHGTNFATSGIWSATGGYFFVTVIAGLGWTLITSWMLYTRATVTERLPETAAARPT